MCSEHTLDREEGCWVGDDVDSGDFDSDFGVTGCMECSWVGGCLSTNSQLGERWV